MAGPITWRNIVGRSLAEASAPLESAGRFFNKAVSSVDDVVRGMQATADQNQQTQDTNAQNAYLDLLQTARTPEQLAAMAPELAAARGRLSAAGQAATRGAQDQRLTTVRGNIIAEQQYSDQQTERVERPIVGGVEQKLARGDITGARTDIAGSNLGAATKARLERMATEIERGNMEWDQKQTAFKWKENAEERAQASHEDQLLTNRANRQGQAIRNEAAQLQIQQTRQLITDTNRIRQGNDLLNKFIMKRHDQVAQANIAINGVVDDYIPPTGTSIPRNPDGTVDLRRMTEKERESFDNFLSNRGLPTSKVVLEGDTVAANEARQALRYAGFKPHEMAQFEQTMAYGFNTSPMALLGNDRALLDTKIANEEQYAAEQASRWGSITLVGERQKLFDVAQKSNSFVDDEDKQNVTGALAEYFRTGGTEVGEGKNKTKIYLGEDDLMEVIAEAADHPLGTTTNQIVKMLKQKDMDNAEKYKEIYAERMKAGARKVDRFEPGSPPAPLGQLKKPK